MNNNDNDNERGFLYQVSRSMDRERCPFSTLWIDEMAQFEEEGIGKETQKLIHSLAGLLAAFEERIITLEREHGIEVV